MGIGFQGEGDHAMLRRLVGAAGDLRLRANRLVGRAWQVSCPFGACQDRPADARRCGTTFTRWVTSHCRTVWSALPATSVLPSGLNATESTAPILLVRTAMPGAGSGGQHGVAGGAGRVEAPGRDAQQPGQGGVSVARPLALTYQQPGDRDVTLLRRLLAGSRSSTCPAAMRTGGRRRTCRTRSQSHPLQSWCSPGVLLVSLGGPSG